MVRRLVIGLVLGFIVGGALAAALIGGLKIATFLGTGGAVLAYATAALAGGLTGLVAGKPIWARDAKTEAGLKAFFGALVGAGAMFGLRQWAGGWMIDLHSIGAGGPGPVAELPGAALPLIAAVLGMFFELDNTGGGDETGRPEGRKRVAGNAGAGEAKTRSARDPEVQEGDADGELEPRRAKR